MSTPFEFDQVGPSAADLIVTLAALSRRSPAKSDAERIDRIRALEDLKAAASAAQARETVAFKQSRIAHDRQSGLPARRHGADVAALRWPAASHQRGAVDSSAWPKR